MTYNRNLKIKTAMPSRFLYIFGIMPLCILILIPKINIVPIVKGSAGLRIDDFVILYCFIIIVYILLKKNNAISQIALVKKYLYFSLYVIISSIIIKITFNTGDLFYAFRYLEYFPFLVCGFYSARFQKARKTIILFFLINSVVAVLQYFSLVGGFSASGFSVDVSNRPIGTTGGPWELGCAANLYCAYFAAQQKKRQSTKFYWGGLIWGWTTIITLLTKSRTAIAAQVYGFFVVDKKNIRSQLILLVTIFFGLVLVYSNFNIINGVIKRSEYLFNNDNLKVFFNQFNVVVPEHAKITMPLGDIGAHGDLSWLYRVNKWTYAIKFWGQNVLFVFFGVGAGAWGPALDGGLLRVLTENGLIGSLLLGMFFFSAIKNGGVQRAVTIMFIINMLLIDMQLAYKAASLLLFILGAEEYHIYYEKNKLSELNADRIVDITGKTAAQGSASA